MKARHSIFIMVAAVAQIGFSVPVHASRTDDRIESSARGSYVFKTYLKGDDIKVQSKKGAVTLTGTVREMTQKILAQDTVAGLPGVRSVDNRLIVKEKRSNQKNDAWLLTKVKTTLLFHSSLNASATEVDVKDGIVTLRGYAETQAQKELTTEFVKDVDEVKGVVNEMTVKTPENPTRTVGNKIDDASITAQVKMTLLYHRSTRTSALTAKVETKNGVVSIYGKAHNAAELDLTTKLAKDVNGVKSVKNRMVAE